MKAASTSASQRIFFSVGEPSGDVHGANLIRVLRQRAPQLEVRGMGGPRMAAAGMELLTDLTQLAVMGLVQVITKIPTFWRLYRRVCDDLDRHPPAAVVLIDFPGFNWWVARAAKRRGIPVFYYGVPQLWAWGRWRLAKMKRLVDHVLCKLPFEAQWYRQQGLQAQYVGHPYFDELLARRLDAEFVRAQQDSAGPLVTLLPGSRRQEVRFNLPGLLKSAREIRKRIPQARFAVAAFNEEQAAMVQAALKEQRESVPIEVHVGRTAELIAAAEACIACSGSVSLELLYHLRPSVIVYRTRRSAWFLLRWLLLKVRYITLVNLLACEDRFETSKGPYDPQTSDLEQVPFPEYAAYWDCSFQVAQHVVQWLQDPARKAACVALLEPLRAELAKTGASARAADYILAHTQGKQQATPAAA